MNKVDYFIVGQGLAGTLLAAELLAAGKTVRIFDGGHEEAASAVAAGVINPITGRRLVKSWMIDELLPAAIKTYKKQETLLNKRFLYPALIHRTIHDPADENLWTTRCGYPDYAAYLSPDFIPGSPAGMEPVPSRGVVRHACRVDLPVFIRAWKAYFLERQLLEINHFDYNDLKMDSDQVTYKDWTAKKIIFCEGYQIINNPWFNFVPMELAKGEVVILEIPDLALEAIYKTKLTFVPLGNDRYWVGATYEWEFDNGRPTQIKKEELLEKIKKDLKMPFKVLDHQAAIRPTIKDRRPVLGTHPKESNILIFNGLGTKGASIGPYWARRMAHHLMDGGAFNVTVDLARFC